MGIQEWRAIINDNENISSSGKLVAYTLANYYRPGSETYPSIDTLIIKTQLSRNTIFKAIEELQSENVLKVEKRVRKNKNAKQNHYSFIGAMSEPMSEPMNDPIGAAIGAMSEPMNDPIGAAIGAVIGATIAPEIDKKRKKKKDTKVSKKELDFEDLWKKYPNKAGKSKAFKSFQKVPDARIQDFTKAFDYYLQKVQGKEIEYIKQGSTFFNQWEDVFTEAIENNGNVSKRETQTYPDWHRCGFCQASNGIVTIKGQKLKCPHGDTVEEVREKLRRDSVNV